MFSLSWYSVDTTFITTIKSIGTACTLAGVGVYLHRFKLVTDEGKHSLALISQQVTIPLYLFTKILYCNQDGFEAACPDVSQTMQDVWILVIWPFYVVICGKVEHNEIKCNSVVRLMYVA
jgi:predicted permease